MALWWWRVDQRAVFQTYLEEVLCPTLKRGQVVVMDNLAHKGERVRELIEGEVRIYLPLLADFNPIEQAFSKQSRSLLALPSVLFLFCSISMTGL